MIIRGKGITIELIDRGDIVQYLVLEQDEDLYPRGTYNRRVTIDGEEWKIHSADCPELNLPNRNIFIRGDDDSEDDNPFPIRDIPMERVTYIFQKAFGISKPKVKLSSDNKPQEGYWR